MKKTILAAAMSVIAISAHAFSVAAHATSAHASVAHVSVAHPVEAAHVSAPVAHETTVSKAESAPVKTSTTKALILPGVHPAAAAKPASAASGTKAK